VSKKARQNENPLYTEVSPYFLYTEHKASGAITATLGRPSLGGSKLQAKVLFSPGVIYPGVAKRKGSC
jgi:hypothetical protein